MKSIFPASILLLSVVTLLLRGWLVSAADCIVPHVYVNDSNIRINQLQYIGTHNSYHVVPSDALMTVYRTLESVTGQYGGVDEWEYTHTTLDYQLTHQNVRHFELDVYYDPEGGLYTNPKVLSVVNETIEPEVAAMLMEPGYKVLHVSDVDFRSTCHTFVECLEQIRNWSGNNTEHVPLMVSVELKEGATPDPLQLGFAKPPKADLLALENEILSVFDRERLITPNELLKNNSLTINQGLMMNGWPTLADSRGKLMFTLQGDDITTGERYPAGVNGSLSDRLFFPTSEPNTNNGAFLLRNEPNDLMEIADLVKQGYMVRTRADAGTKQARTGSYERRDWALSSGAQYVSTDYPYPQLSPPNIGFGTNYSVSLPTRCNPVNGPIECWTGIWE